MCEYMDGELLQKSRSTLDHSQVQANVIDHVDSSYRDDFRPLPEVTTQLSETRFFVPDVVVCERAKKMSGEYPGPGEPVFLCVEIMSLDERVGKLWRKCEDYHAWGVPYCWVVDPQRRVAWEYEPGDAMPRRREEGSLKAGRVEISFEDLFRDLE